MKKYMIVEDDPRKTSGYKAFIDFYAGRGVGFRAKESARSAITELQDPKARAQLAGVIADFQLGHRRDTHDKRIEVAGPDGEPYSVSTGLGVLDWIHNVDPTLPLWALTNDTATHAPLFMSAASLWLDAKPLNVERLSNTNNPLSDRMFEELLHPQNYEKLNPLWSRIDESRAAFGALMNTPYSGAEAFDWLNALTHLAGATGGFIPALTKKIQQLTLDRDLNAYSNTLSSQMALWQLRLAEIYEDFPVDREEEQWPVIHEENLPKKLDVWREFNPITEFLGAHSECQEFFAAQDVRMALTRWRGRGDQP